MTFAIGTISHGTLRPQDLLVSFSEAYEQLWQEAEIGYIDKSLVVGAKVLAYWMEHNTPSPMEYDVAGEFLDDLILKLEAIAAVYDCYFGATEGDGSDFGFWPNAGGKADDPFQTYPDEIGIINPDKENPL